MSDERRGDLVAVGIEVVLLAAAIGVGAALLANGVPLWLDAPPLYARWAPHVSWGTPAAVAVAAAVVWWLPRWVPRAPWWRLLAVGYLAALAWILALAMVDGWADGLATRLTPQAEYLTEVPRITDIPAMLAGFTDRILDFRPGSWSTHTAGHPPGALLVFVWLDRIGLGGGGAAALACVVIGATVTVSVPVTLRALGDEAAARAVLPFLVLFPGAVWVGASADGLFAGVVAAGLALLAVRGWLAGFAGGLLLGFALYLSYGYLLAGALALAVLLLRDRLRLAVLAAAAAGMTVVAAAFTGYGFWWPDGYRLVVERYFQGWAADRPYGYFVWANLACLVLVAGPALGPALWRAVAAVRRRSAVTWLPIAAASAIVAADLSGLSKAEVERIWLPFAVWLLVACARLPRNQVHGWLAAQAATALAVNHLLWTGW